MEKNLQHTILKALVHDEKFCRTALPHLKQEYFQNESKAVYDLILSFISKYNKLPTRTVLEIELEKSEYVTSQIYSEICSLIKDLDHYEKNDFDWLVNTTEKWCKDRAVHIAIMESISIIDGSNKKDSEGSIPDILSKALSVTFDTSVGHDYTESAEERYEFYHRKENKIEFDLDIFNKITNGGIGRKTFNVILAGPYCGKSLTMCHLSAGYLSMGYNVLYITLELAEEKIAERIDANLMNTSLDDISKIEKDTYLNKIKNIASKSRGKLIIKEYPTGAAHVGHFRALIQELKMKKNFAPDIICVDYLNLCTSSRLKGLSSGINSYSLIKSIGEELRGFAVETNTGIWSATQTTRCLALDTKIINENGEELNIEDVSVGDKILSCDDKFVTVNKVYPVQKVEAYEIELEDGNIIRCSGEHIFPTDSGLKSINSGLSTNDSFFVLQK